MIPLTRKQVEDALERPLTDDEVSKSLTGRATKSSNLLEGYLGVVYSSLDTIPSVVTDVAAGMVARLYQRDDQKITAFQEQAGATMGPFSYSNRVNADVVAGGPWITKADKAMLRTVYSGYRSVPVQSGYGIPDDTDC